LTLGQPLKTVLSAHLQITDLKIVDKIGLERQGDWVVAGATKVVRMVQDRKECRISTHKRELATSSQEGVVEAIKALPKLKD